MQGSIQNLDPKRSAGQSEVIKDRKSALYGRNTYAGAIISRTKAVPESSKAGGK